MNDLLIEQDVEMMSDDTIVGLGLEMETALINELKKEGLQHRYLSKYDRVEMILIGAKILKRLAHILYNDEEE